MRVAKGWIKIHRSLVESAVWSDPLRLKAWIDLLLRVNHEDKELFYGGELIKVEKGQCITSGRKLADAWGCSEKTARKIVDQFVDLGMVRRYSRKGRYAVLTVVKYGIYQGGGRTDYRTDDSTDYHYEDSTEDSTDYRTDYLQTRMNKNDKNDKNELKNDKEPKNTASPFKDPWGRELE
jgi:hypothetical protein